ncbi:MAG: MFS transporter [Candidatus Aminicenantes bacterium]|nr:MFS transporter [Candidatus Aminicenantes bacterium]
MKKKVLFSASIFHALNDAASVTVPMVFPLLYSQQFIIKKYFHIGILCNLGLLVTFLFHIILVNVSNKFEYKHMILVSYLGICLSLVLMTFSSAFTSFLLIYLAMRVFNSFYHSIGVAWVSKTHPSQGIDFAMGIQSGSGNLGVFVAFITSGYLAQTLGWEIPLFVWAAAGFLLGSISFMAVRKTSTRSTEIHKPTFSSWIETMKNIQLYIPAFIFGGACWGTTVFYAPSLLNHKFKTPLGQTGLYLALWIGIGAVMTYLFGFLSRRFGRLKILLCAFTGATLFLYLLWIAPVKELALVSLLFFGTFLFLIFPCFQSFVGNEVPAKNLNQAFSLSANVQMLTGAVVALIAGFLSDKFGINSPFLFLGMLGTIITIFYLLKSPLIAQKLSNTQ